MKYLTRRGAFFAIPAIILAPLLSSCGEDLKSVENLDSEENLLREFFYRQVTVDLESLRDAAKEFSLLVEDINFRDGTDLYDGLQNLDEKTLGKTEDLFLKVSNWIDLFDLSEISEQFQKTFLIVISSLSAGVVAESIGSEGEILIDSKSLHRTGEKKSTFSIDGVGMSSTKSSKIEMGEKIEKAYPGTLHLVKESEGWRIEGKSFIENISRKEI